MGERIIMIEKLNDIEAVKVAANLERDGIAFYTRAAEVARNEETKKIFLRLADQEKDHLETFREWEHALKETDQGAQYWDAPEIDAYIRNLIQTGVFSEGPEKMAAGAESDRDALLVGIGAEKDSILFYSEAARLSRSEQSRKIFAALAEVEKEHLGILVGLLQE